MIFGGGSAVPVCFNHHNVLTRKRKEGKRMSYCPPHDCKKGHGEGFVLLIVLFILLVIIGTAYVC